MIKGFFSVFFVKPSMVVEAQKAKFKPIFILQVLIFLGIFIVTQIASAIPVVMYIILMMIYKRNLALQPDSVPGMSLALLFCTSVTTLLVIVYCRFIEKRSFNSMGFTRYKAARHYLKGLLVGFVMFGASVLISAAAGTLEYNGIVLGSGLILLFAFFAGFVLQGMSEEVAMRGYFMVSVATKAPVIVAILANSVIFALMHLLNDGITALSLVNLTLFGVFASVYTLKSNSLWGIGAIHTMWNFAQGNIFGIAVSGNKMETSVFSFTPTDAGALINGGSFGLEGGLAVTAVLLAGVVVTMLVKGRSQKVLQSESAVV
ncbi:MAG TPA: CPBP family intramembrane glutamic endopeptidase [Clostridia bacterium]|nr:CPBP family intramembrane glutamic endopeptidase [Clostridia bacterium]